MRWYWGLLVPFTAIAAFTCSNNDDGSTLSTASEGSGANTTASGMGGSIIGQNCDPPCVAPQFCSVTEVCLDSGQCADDADCEQGAECTDQGVCTGCNPPNLLIVLDRSCSMQPTIGNKTKWEIAVEALNKLTTDFKDEIRFGLTLFPDIVTPPCEQDAIPIPVGPGNEPAIQALLNGSLSVNDPYYPDLPCVTNIDTAMAQAATEPALNDTDRPSYVLLLTDGKQAGCPPNGDLALADAATTQTITDLYQNRDVPTFVIGFDTGADQAQLNTFAAAGGVPANDMSCSPPCGYYNAVDAAALDAALDDIAAKVSCGGGIE